MIVKKIFLSDIYRKWFKSLKDRQAKMRILARVDRLAAGNPGDNRFLGEISELRIFYGPGYRVYYYQDTGEEIILLLCGGDKTTQQEDIARAREIAQAYTLHEED